MDLTHSESVVQKWQAWSVVQDSVLWESSVLNLHVAMVHVSGISHSGPGSIKHQSD